MKDSRMNNGSVSQHPQDVKSAKNYSDFQILLFYYFRKAYEC